MKKNFITSLLVSILLISLVASCSKNQNSNKMEDPNNLSEDKAFIQLATETYDYLLFVSNNLKQVKLTQSEIQNNLAKIQAQTLNYEEQMKSIDLLFKNSFSIRLEKHMKTYVLIWKDLNSRYSDISQEILEKECAEVLSNKFSNSNRDVNAKKDCGWKFYLCAGAATAGAVLCHAGCETTALATTAGLGIPACVAACGTLQAWAIVQCEEKYCTESNPLNPS
jgi:hypothetical protein